MRLLTTAGGGRAISEPVQKIGGDDLAPPLDAC
jgi:hypothetical protein